MFSGAALATRPDRFAVWGRGAMWAPKLV